MKGSSKKGSKYPFLSSTIVPTYSGAWNPVNGACIWVRGRGGRADPLIRDQIWAFHLHIARTTPGYLCVLLAHIAHMCTHLHIYIYIYTRSELLTCPLHRCTAICARCHILYIARPTLSVLRCWHILHMMECILYFAPYVTLHFGNCNTLCHV